MKNWNENCNGIELSKCDKVDEVNYCNFCIDEGIIYMLVNKSTSSSAAPSKIPLFKDKLLGQGKFGQVYLFKSKNGEHELAIKTTDEKEISEEIKNLDESVKKFIVPSIFTAEKINDISDSGIKMIMPRFLSLKDKALEMSVSNFSDKDKIETIIKYFKKLDEANKAITTAKLSYDDQKLDNFLIDKDDNVYFGDIGSFNSPIFNKRSTPNGIFEDFCQITFNGMCYYTLDKLVPPLVSELYLSEGVSNIVADLKKEKKSFSDISKIEIDSYTFNDIKLKFNSISPDNRKILEEYSYETIDGKEEIKPFEVYLKDEKNDHKLILSIYMELKRIIFDFNEFNNGLGSGSQKISSLDLDKLKDASVDQEQNNFFDIAALVIYLVKEAKEIHDNPEGVRIYNENLQKSFKKLNTILIETVQDNSNSQKLENILNKLVGIYEKFIKSPNRINIDAFETLYKQNKLAIKNNRRAIGQDRNESELKVLIELKENMLKCLVEDPKTVINNLQLNVERSDITKQEQDNQFVSKKEFDRKIGDIERRLSLIENKRSEIAGGDFSKNKKKSIYKVIYRKN